MPECKFELGQIVVHATDANTMGRWLAGARGIVEARAVVEHIGLTSRPEYFVSWSDGRRLWYAEQELAMYEPERPSDKP